MMLFFVCGILHMLLVGYKYKHRSDFLSTERKYYFRSKIFFSVGFSYIQQFPNCNWFYSVVFLFWLYGIYCSWVINISIAVIYFQRRENIISVLHFLQWKENIISVVFLHRMAISYWFSLFGPLELPGLYSFK